jgi:hypothetical protein
MAMKAKSKRKYAKCRMLTGEELGALLEKILAAHDRRDRVEVRRLKKEFMNGFYGEVRA